MATGRRLGDPVEGPCVLPARVAEPGVVVGLPVVFGVVAGLEGHPVVHEPLEMPDGVPAVLVQLLRIDIRPARGGQERLHLLRAVVEATGQLYGGPPAHVDDPARHGGRATAGGGGLQHQHLGTRLGRLDGRACPRTTQAHDHDIGLHVPPAHLLGGEWCEGFGSGGGLVHRRIVTVHELVNPASRCSTTSARVRVRRIGGSCSRIGLR